MSKKTIAIGCDHAGLGLKTELMNFLKNQGYEVVNLGTDTSDSVDYPDFGYAIAEALKSNKAQMGVAVCGSGIGISMAMNRFSHIRCALIHDHLGAKMTRQHNDANVIAFGDRMIGIETAKDALDTFIKTEFEGGRHERRVEKLSNPPQL